MGDIQILPEHTINQIAAGEVVENPSSVVKELVENSLDAKSKVILVEILTGGFGLIRITDDGVGMEKDDAILALERHATSKIKKLEDLFLTRSMGFRGEALASISSISKFSMVTAKENNEHLGYRIFAEAGKIKSMDNFSRKRGTTIEVRSLFYNVPARKKFQKSSSASMAEITKALTRLALSRPDVEFKLLSDNRCVLHVKPFEHLNEQEQLSRRISEVLSSSFLKGASFVSFQEKDVKITGFVGAPDLARHNRSGQFLFINQRAVSSNEISLAVTDGYGSMLESKKHPTFVLLIQMDTTLVDVNVHPQKKEVRLKESSHLKSMIRTAVGKAFLLEGEKMHNPIVEEVVDQEFGLDEEAQAFASFPKTFRKEGSFEEKPLEPVSFEKPKGESFIPNDQESNFYRQSVKEFKESVVANVEETDLPWENKGSLHVSDLSILGIYKHYMIVEAHSFGGFFSDLQESSSQGLVFIDLRAASSRVYYEKILSRVLKEHQQTLDIQTLLFPKTFECTAAEAKALLPLLDSFKQMGIVMRSFGETSFIIEALATYLTEDMIEPILQLSLQEKKVDPTMQDLEIFKKLAQRASTMAMSKNDRFDKQKGIFILKELFSKNLSKYSPFGKPIFSLVDDNDIENFFKSSSSQEA